MDATEEVDEDSTNLPLKDGIFWRVGFVDKDLDESPNDDNDEVFNIIVLLDDVSFAIVILFVASTSYFNNKMRFYPLRCLFFKRRVFRFDYNKNEYFLNLSTFNTT